MTVPRTLRSTPPRRRHSPSTPRRHRPGHGRPGARTALIALMVADGAAIFGLHAAKGPARAQMDWTAQVTWLRRSPEEVALAGLHILALALAYWLAAAIITGLIGAVRENRTQPSWYAIPAVRRLIEQALAVGVTVTTTASALATPALTGLAAAAEDGSGPLPPIPVLVQPAAPEPPAPIPTPPSVVDWPAAPIPAPHRAGEPVSPEMMRAPTTERAGSYVVQPGDSLWSIAADQLAALHGGSPCESEVSAYWAALIDANRAGLRSGDPDLIYPGERVQLVAVAP